MKCRQTNQRLTVRPSENTRAEELKNEFNYLRAKQITGMLLSRGLVTPDEYRLIMAENKITFPTFLSAIL